MKLTMIGHDGEPYINLDEAIKFMLSKGSEIIEDGDRELGFAFIDVAECLRDCEIFMNQALDAMNELIDLGERYG
jgi:hypothetical protein